MCRGTPTVMQRSPIRPGPNTCKAMAYATPLCSALLLGAIGLASLTWGLLVGAMVIVTAGVLSRTDGLLR